MSLTTALAGLRNIQQWFIWRFEWDGQEAKYQKTPCALNGSVYRLDASLPSNWTRYETAERTVAALNASPACADRRLQYALGFWMTADCGYWFLDIDKCVVDGVLAPFAAQMVAAFPGALFEYSSSKKGVHVIGRGVAPTHRSKPPQDVSKQLLPLQLEFYTDGRGIAFGLDGVATGSADAVHDAMVAQLCAQYFPPRAEGEKGDFATPRADWRGPADDDALISKALNARGSAAAAFGGKASFGQLWRGEVEGDSSSDMALASHLAFWTGCDLPRIDRLMRRSGLKRDKWDEYRPGPGGTYLSFTICNACATCGDVYQEPERSVAMQTELYGAAAPVAVTHVAGGVITEEMFDRLEVLLGEISACGTVKDLHNIVLPRIRDAGIPRALGERLVSAIARKLDYLDSKLPIGQIRALVYPPTTALSRVSDPPLWVQRHCYVKDGDYFLDMENGAVLTYAGFNAEYGRLMPTKDSGAIENAAEWALHRWMMRTVQKVAYRPDQGPYFSWDGLDHANTYNANSIPAVLPLSAAGYAGIVAMTTHLFDMCGRRQDVFYNMLWWLAHNVQKPGVKIRWSPILKGTPGDGKTLMTNVLRAAMGHRNVGVTGNATLTASGGFNDWALRAAVNIIEEIMLTGKVRHQLYNAMKEFISNNQININSKGAKTYDAYNCTNHWANTNHNDAIPLETEDRRWFVIFTPWSSLPDMQRYCGLTPEAWKERTDAIDSLWNNHAGELRGWFLSLQIGPEFDVRGSAPMTPEKKRMMASSQDDAESVASQIIADGSHGITANAFSSACLSNILKVRALQEGFELPRGMALNHMLTRMGYSRLSKLVKWRNSVHTIWIKNGFDEDNNAVRLELDRTLT